MDQLEIEWRNSLERSKWSSKEPKLFGKVLESFSLSLLRLVLDL